MINLALIVLGHGAPIIALREISSFSLLGLSFVSIRLIKSSYATWVWPISSSWLSPSKSSIKNNLGPWHLWPGPHFWSHQKHRSFSLLFFFLTIEPGIISTQSYWAYGPSWVVLVKPWERWAQTTSSPVKWPVGFPLAFWLTQRQLYQGWWIQHSYWHPDFFF